MRDKIRLITEEINKVIIGKEDVVKKVLTVILAGGHVLLEDIPGVGKTTMALAFSKAMSLSFNRVQFTPDVVPSDITGFTMFNREKGEFEYKKGAAMCNFFLADEINRTSSKTQSALLEVMQEGKVTVDGESHSVPKPFIVVATQNPVGTAGTQMLPEAQLDRFMMKLSLGYPTVEEQVTILMDRENKDPIDQVKAVVTKEELIAIKEESQNIYTDEKILRYIADLAEATRKNDYIKLGMSPRGALALSAAAKAWAYIRGGEYVVPEDVEAVFADVVRHRLVIYPKAIPVGKTDDILIKETLETVKAPKEI